MIQVSNRSFTFHGGYTVEEVSFGTRVQEALRRYAVVIVAVAILLLIVLVAPQWAFQQVLNLMDSLGNTMARLTEAFRPVYVRILDIVFLRVLVYMAPLWLWLGGELMAYIRNPGKYSAGEALFKRDGMFSIVITLALVSLALVCGAPFVYLTAAFGSIIIMLLPVLRSYQALMTARNLTELARIGAQLKVTEAALTEAKASGQAEVQIEMPDFNSSSIEMKFWTKWAWLICSLILRIIVGLAMVYGFPLVCAVP